MRTSLCGDGRGWLRVLVEPRDDGDDVGEAGRGVIHGVIVEVMAKKDIAAGTLQLIAG